MSEINKLKNWMDEQGYTMSTLAQEIGVGYYGVYFVFHRNRISPGFKVRFSDRFGADVARTIFEPTPRVAVPEMA